MKVKLLILCLLTCIYSHSQNDKTLFIGKIIDSTNAIKNVHIVNLNNNKGTFSNEFGVFKIPAKENDSVQVTSIGYKTKNIKVKAFQLREKLNIIFLESETYNLDEIELKKHNLTGYLSIDLKKTPTTYKEKAVADIMEQLLNLDFYAISKMGIDFKEIHLSKPNEVRLPDNKFEGFGTGIGLSNKRSKIVLLSEKLEEEKEIPDKLLSEFGSYFFFTELKIPKEKYYHFISYCSFKNIFELYLKKENFKIIKILKAESKSYLELLKNKD